MKKKTVQKNMVVILDEKDRDKLFAVAKKRGITVSDLVRPWVEKKIHEMSHRERKKFKIKSSELWKKITKSIRV
ncbi:hypothetical protein ES705_15607 [subsurface metagenome]